MNKNLSRRAPRVPNGIATLPTIAVLLVSCGPLFRLGDVNPHVQKARDLHGEFLRLDPRGFGVDSGRPLFYDSFENGLGKWLPVASGSDQKESDRWNVTPLAKNFGVRALTYGQDGPKDGVIVNNVEYGKATLTTKDAISLVPSLKPVLIIFAGFVREGRTDDRTALRVEASADLGFSWMPLLPSGLATDSISGPVSLPGAASSIWQRFRFDLAPFRSSAVQFRISVSATANNRTLPYVDDVLVTDAR